MYTDNDIKKNFLHYVKLKHQLSFRNKNLKVDHHTRGKWFIYGPDSHKYRCRAVKGKSICWSTISIHFVWVHIIPCVYRLWILWLFTLERCIQLFPIKMNWFCDLCWQKKTPVWESKVCAKWCNFFVLTELTVSLYYCIPPKTLYRTTCIPHNLIYTYQKCSRFSEAFFEQKNESYFLSTYDIYLH